MHIFLLRCSGKVTSLNGHPLEGVVVTVRVYSKCMRLFTHAVASVCRSLFCHWTKSFDSLTLRYVRYMGRYTHVFPCTVYMHGGSYLQSVYMLLGAR